MMWESDNKELKPEDLTANERKQSDEPIIVDIRIELTA